MTGVGYRKPPVEHQFKKGQSGNPKGRPRGASSLEKDFADIFSRAVEVQSGEKRRRTTTAKAAMRQLCSKALKGDAVALRRVFELIVLIDRAQHTAAETTAANEYEVRQRIARLLGRTTLPPFKAG